MIPVPKLTEGKIASTSSLFRRWLRWVGSLHLAPLSTTTVTGRRESPGIVYTVRLSAISRLGGMVRISTTKAGFRTLNTLSVVLHF